MSNLTNNNIFNLKLQYQIFDDDPIRKLSSIFEDMDFTKLLQVFSYKTKVHPIRMFAIILYAYSRGIHSTFRFFSAFDNSPDNIQKYSLF